MTSEKILEIARRYGDHDLSDVDWYFYSPDLISFAQSVIEAVQEETTIKVPASVFVKIVKDVNTVKDLLIALKAAEEAE
jgi:hypothetical protein